jgi:16S rRNA (uracil1498-N3)-methyltransferase
LVLRCSREGLTAAEEWLGAHLSAAALSGEFRGLRVEEGPEGDDIRLVLTFASPSGRARLADLVSGGRPASAGPGGRPPVTLEKETEEPDTDWVAAVEATVRAVPLGRRYAALPGQEESPGGRRPIRVPRTRAFGTGEHPSTRLAASLVEERTEPGSAVLDVGTGTGILAAVALLQGAGRALGLDRDPAAIEVAAVTRAINGLTGLDLVCGTVECLRPGLHFRTVAANIERDVLMEALPTLARLTAPGGHVILSGLLASQVDEVAAAGRRWGLEEADRRQEGEWSALDLSADVGRRPRALVEPGAVTSEEVRLSRAESHHLLRVRRLTPGTPVVLLDGRGGCWSGRLFEQGGGAIVRDLREEAPATEAGPAVILLQAVLHEAGRMETVIRQATELGVSRIVPVVTARCQSGTRWLRHWPEQRWRRIAAEAVKQCGRVRIPGLEEPRLLDEVLKRRSARRRLLLDPGGRPLTAVLLGPPPSAVEVLVGPEGGLTPAERRRASTAGFAAVRLGPRILRADTAAAAAVTTVMAAWEDLDAGRPVP